jgi:hypothetical protein
MTPTVTAAPLTELDQLKQQNALLLRRLMVVSRERDDLRCQLEALQQPQHDAP